MVYGIEEERRLAKRRPLPHLKRRSVHFPYPRTPRSLTRNHFNLSRGLPPRHPERSDQTGELEFTILLLAMLFTKVSPYGTKSYR